MAVVTALGLDTTQRKHGLAGQTNHVRTHRKCKQCVGWKSETAGAREDDFLVQAGFDEGRVDPGKGRTKGQRHMVAKCQGSSAGAALAAIDSNEVGTLLAFCHALGERCPEVLLTHGRLDTYRQPGGIGDLLNEVDQAIDIVECRVAIWAVDGLADLDAACLSDCWGDLLTRKHATEPRLGSLTELDFDAADVGRWPN